MHIKPRRKRTMLSCNKLLVVVEFRKVVCQISLWDPLEKQRYMHMLAFSTCPASKSHMSVASAMQSYHSSHREQRHGLRPGLAPSLQATQRFGWV